MSTGPQETTIDIVTQHHLYSGTVLTEGRRVAEILSDSNSDLLDLSQVRVSGAGARSARIRCGRIVLRKKHIMMAFLQGEHEAPVRRRNNYQQKDRYGTMLVLPGYILSGIVHLPSRANSRMVLDEQTTLPSFFGVTDVEFHSSIYDLAPTQSDVVIVRHEFIEAIHLTPKPLAQPDQDVGERLLASELMD